jgi:hypothetical protein
MASSTILLPRAVSTQPYSMIELMNGGAFLNLTGDLVYKALKKIAANSQNWDFTSCRDKSAWKDKK